MSWHTTAIESTIIAATESITSEGIHFCCEKAFAIATCGVFECSQGNESTSNVVMVTLSLAGHSVYIATK